jgi:hypothetical protein
MSTITYPQVLQTLLQNPNEGKKLAEFLMTNRNTRENALETALQSDYKDRIVHNSKVSLSDYDFSDEKKSVVIPIISLLTISSVAFFVLTNKK